MSRLYCAYYDPERDWDFGKVITAVATERRFENLRFSESFVSTYWKRSR